MQFHFEALLKKKQKKEKKLSQNSDNLENSPKIGETFGKLEESPKDEEVIKDTININEIKIEEIPQGEEYEIKDNNIIDNNNNINIDNKEEENKDDIVNIIQSQELKAQPLEEPKDMYIPGKKEI